MADAGATPARPRPGGRLGRALLVAAGLLAFLLQGGLALRGKSATADEAVHLRYGERALTAGTFLRDEPDFNSKMPVSVLNALPLEAARRLGYVPGSWGRLYLARVPTLLLGALLGWLVFAWARRLFGFRAGLCALALYCFCPNLLAHSRLVTTDVAASLGIFAAAFAGWRWLEAPSGGRLAAAGLALGAAQLTKATAIFLLPIGGLLAAVPTVRARLRRGPDGEGPGAAAGRAWPSLLVLCLLALAVLNLGFGFEGTGRPLAGGAFESAPLQALARLPGLSRLPVPLPYPYLQGLDMQAADVAGPHWVYLAGRYSERGFVAYFPLALALKATLPLLLLAAAAFGLWLSGRVRAPAAAEAFLLVPIAFFALYFTFFFPLQIGLRFLLPLFPFLFVFASRVAAWRPRRLPAGAAVAALLAWHAASSLAVHPHYLAYFNELAGGPRNGWRYFVDSNLDWGQDNYAAVVLYPRASPVEVIAQPRMPRPGRLVVSANSLVGMTPAAARDYAWLREGFEPVDQIGYSWLVYDVTPEALAACCGRSSWPVPGSETNLAPAGRPLGGAEGVDLAGLERLNDGSLGRGQEEDAARTQPPAERPFRAWFGVEWQEEQRIGRVLAYPALYSRGECARAFLALDAVLERRVEGGWVEVPGTRVEGNDSPYLELRFPPVATTAVRLVIERQRNQRGEATAAGEFRAACLELAVYPR